MMTHLDLVAVLNLISTIAIVDALVFTGLQVRAANRARQEQPAIVVIQTTQNERWTRALGVISTLPHDTTLEQISEQGATAEQALFDLSIRLETIAYMVFCRIVSLRAIDDLIGGVTMVFWSRAKTWTENFRTKTSNAKFNEWCEWLANRLTERRAQVGNEPAQRQHRDWRER
jgi:hypothetical protein